MVDMNPAGMYLMRLASGTSANPVAWPMPMIMTPAGKWNLMFMGVGFLSEIQQSGRRGDDKLYSTNWMMASAEHRLGSGAFQAELMLSLEPATVTSRRYPLLFQTGETAYGVPLVDAQHPHNFIMALGFHYAQRIASYTTLDLFFAPVGDPALGPTAYPHRASAMELPQASIAHHLQDSTHIADDVITMGIQRRQIKIEASGFHGAEPGEDRWQIDTGAIDSWSTRFWFFPTRNWAAQFSYGRLTHPEALDPGDQSRTTASVEYTRPMAGSSWSSSLIWGHTHNTATRRDLDSFLAETVVPVRRGNFITSRVEVADKDELFRDRPALDGRVFRIGAYTAGYTRDLGTVERLAVGIGANFTAYSVPETIRPYYGAHPVGANVFLRVRLKPE